MSIIKMEATRFNNNVINLNALRDGTSRKLAAGLIAPAIEDTLRACYRARCRTYQELG